MARIAHISDIHFGKTFDDDIWNRIKEEIVGFGPRTIIASGDFTDDPDPLLLLAAKCELEVSRRINPINGDSYAAGGQRDRT